MSEKNTKDKEGMIIGGATLLGVGVGFTLLEESALLFLASILIGLGFGLVIAALASKK